MAWADTKRVINNNHIISHVRKFEISTPEKYVTDFSVQLNF